MLETLARLPAVTVAFALREGPTLRAGAWPAAALRGALGAELRRSMPERFEAAFGGGDRPSPLALRVRVGAARHAGEVRSSEGDGSASSPWSVEATWFGESSAPWLVEALRGAFARVGATGIGEAAQSFADCAISRGVLPVASAGAALPERVEAAGGARTVCVRLETPLRSRSVSRPRGVASLPWTALLAAITTRLRGLVAAFAPAHTRALADALARLDDALPPRACACDVRAATIERWSSRQRARVFAAGLVGTATYAGVSASAHAVLEAAERLHAGSGTSAGLGWVRVEVSS